MTGSKKAREMRIQTYLINLDGSDERLASATRQLAAQGIDFERVAAFDGRGRELSSIAQYDPEGAQAYMGRPLRGGEIGCYLSHLDCARRFLSSNADYGLVLEDDMELHPDSYSRLISMLQWLADRPADWEVINLAANRDKYSSPLKTFGRYSLARGHYFPMTTTAILWTRAGATAFVRDHATVRMPVDNALREWQSTVDRGLTVTPGLITTTGSESDIDGGQPLRNKGGRSLLYELKKQRRMLRNKLRAWLHRRAWRRQHPSA